MIGNLAKRLDDEFYKQLPPFYHESHKAQTLHALGEDYDDDTTRHVDMALDHLEAAMSAVVRDAVVYIGRQLEQDFGGLRAPRLVAWLVNHTFGLRPKLTEHQVRYSCGWIKRRA